jgi:general secretion pathway protein G
VLQRLRAARHNDEGFTLVELLIVIVILGVLAGIVVFAVNGITDRGELAACKADVQSVQTAAEAYYAKNTDYPATVDGLAPDFIKTIPHPTKYSVTYTRVAGPPLQSTVVGNLNGKDCITGAVIPPPGP